MPTMRVQRSIAFRAGLLALFCAGAMSAQSFGTSTLDFGAFGGVSAGTSLAFGPDGRLYVMQVDGTLDVFAIERNGPDDYVVVDAEEILAVKSIPNHDDDGSADATFAREATGIAVAGTATNPIVYATSSDSRIGGPSGDTDLDTNSGVITRLAWQGTDTGDPSGFWEVVDLVRGLPRSEENHATNGLEFATVAGDDFLIVSSGGHTNAGSPSTNFAWHTEYALSAAVLAVNLSDLEAMPIQNDGARDYVYDLPTVDDPTRANANGISDPNAPGYDGVDVGDPWGGNDGLNQAKLVAGGPVSLFSPGYRNTYDLVLTGSGAVYVTDNGANGGWGGYPDGEGLAGNATNAYRPGEPGSNGADAVYGDPQVNNQDSLSLVTTDITTYLFGSFYGGHPAPVRANPAGAGLFTRGAHSSDPGDSNGNGYTDDWFRTVPFDPNGSGDAANPQRALPADWPPVPVGLANPVEGDYRNPGGANPDGPVDAIVTTWQNNTNGIDEYTASNFGGAMQGDLIAGRSGGNLHRVQLAPDGSLDTLTENWVSGIGGNPLGITANGDSDPFPGTIWVATLNDAIVVLEPQDFVECILPGDPGYDPNADNDFDGYANQDEEDNATDACNGGSQPGDFDKAAGGALVSDRNDADDDADGILDADDPMQIGDPVDAGSDAFDLPVINELFSDNPQLGGYLGLGFTGLMNSGAPNPNWLDWIDVPGDGPNPNDVLGGAVGAMTMQMTEGSAVGASNDQEKGFQYGVDVDLETVGFAVRGRLLNFGAGLQLYPFPGDGELGIFLGDGTQSDFIQLVVHDGGIELLAEVGDAPQTPLHAPIAEPDRPTASLDLELAVDSATGEVEAFYAIDGGPFVAVGSVFATGSVLAAIQQADVPVMVGLIGTSNTPGAEVEGTWDFLNVVGLQPGVESAIADRSEPLGGAPSLQLDLDDHFEDDAGDAGLTYTIESVTNPQFGVGLVGSMLTIDFPAFAATATITVRATDADGYFVEQTFSVSVLDPVAIYRVNAGGPQVSAIDGGIDWAQDTTGSNSAHLAIHGGNNSAGFAMAGYTPAVDTATTPTSIYGTERWASTHGAPSMRYAFPIAEEGDYEVRLYMGNGWDGANDPNERVFSVTIEGDAHPDLTNLDLTATFGHQIGGVVSHTAHVDDGTLEVDFFHGSANNPMLNGIEVIGGVSPPPPPPPSWIDLAEDENYTARHECSFVQAGDRFYLFGGRENAQTLDTYDYAADSWSTSASAPIPFNHFQATEHEGLVFVIGAFQTNSFPNEDPAEEVWAYDPANDVWIEGPPIPAARRRGSAGLVVHDGRFYAVGGNTDGHDGGYVAWFDEFDPETGVWTPLADAPHARDHFHAGYANGKLYAAGGRLSGGPGGTFAPLIPEVDVYDFATNTWSTLPAASDLPTPRAASAVAVHDGELLVIGGEGNGQAYGTVEALDLSALTWRSLDSLNHARHGTQAIVSGQGIYVAGGSPNQGGGNQKNMEVYPVDLPAGAPSTAGALSTPAEVSIDTGTQEDFAATHSGGNQGVYVESVALSGADADDFILVTPFFDPFLIPTGGQRDFTVAYMGTTAVASASLDITHSGGQLESVTLLPEPDFLWYLTAGALALEALRRRRQGA